MCILATQQLRLQFHKRTADQQLHAITLARELQSMLAEVAAQQSVRLAAAEERGVGMGEKGRRLRETGLIGGTLRGERAGAAAGANGAIRRKGLEAAVEIRCEATAPEGERGGRGYGRMERSLSKQLHSALLERGCTPVPGVVAL